MNISRKYAPRGIHRLVENYRSYNDYRRHPEDWPCGFFRKILHGNVNYIHWQCDKIIVSFKVNFYLKLYTSASDTEKCFWTNEILIVGGGSKREREKYTYLQEIFEIIAFV